MEYYLWFEYSLNNNGFTLETYLFDVAIPARTIYLILAVVVVLRARKKIRDKRRA